MEASAAHPPLSRSRRKLGSGPLLRLRSDEQLVAAFRGGSEEAFTVIHDRYRQRLFAYCRQMLNGPRQDAEDVLQDVLLRAYSALRNDERTINLRAWLYRVAHNRCIDHLRRPTPSEQDIFELSRMPLHDPIVEAQRRDDLRRLVQDVAALPEQQRSALLMREIDGISYQDLATALDVTVPAIKSLLVRARMGLAEAAEARDMDCSIIREDLTAAFDRGVRASGRARRHLRECSACREYKGALRGTKAQFAALAGPATLLGPLALLAKIGIGGGSGAGAAGAGAAAAGGGGVAAIAGAASTGKVAAVVAGVAIATGGAVEVKRYADHHAMRDGGSERSAREARQGSGAARGSPHADGTPATTAALARRGDRATPSRGSRSGEPLARRDRRAHRRRGRAARESEAAPIMPADGTEWPPTTQPDILPGIHPDDDVRGGSAKGPAGTPAPTSPGGSTGDGSETAPPGTAPPGTPPPTGSTSSAPPGTTP